MGPAHREGAVPGSGRRRFATGMCSHALAGAALASAAILIAAGPALAQQVGVKGGIDMAPDPGGARLDGAPAPALTRGSYPPREDTP
jgi:hypothetical protein